MSDMESKQPRVLSFEIMCACTFQKNLHNWDSADLQH